jgi:Predicted dehydrogenases and related proteins
MKTIRAAIVGTGAVAHLHAEAIKECGNGDLVAVVNRSSERGQAFADKWNVPHLYSTIEELFANEEIDIVHLCTPPQMHLEQAKIAFANGAHVICEKPAALSLTQIDEMLDAAKAADLFFAIVFQQRTGSAASWVKQQLQSGTFGRPLVAQALTLWYRDAVYYDVDWRGTWDVEGGGTTLGHGAHQLDLLAYLLGDWTEVDGRLWRLDRDVEFEDVSTATIQFACGAVATAVSSVLSPRETSIIRIDTELATVEVEHLYGHSNQNWRITPAPSVPPEISEKWKLPSEDEPSSHKPLVREVYAAITNGEDLPDLVAHQRRAMELVAAIYASSTHGKPVTPDSLASDQHFQRSLRAAVTHLK